MLKSIIAMSPHMKVRDSNAKDIIIIDTWILNRGDDSTGIIGVICGSICPICDTRRKKPDIRKPNVIRIWNLLYAIKEKSITNHAIINIVSYPLAIGILPLIIHLKISQYVKHKKEKMSILNDINDMILSACSLICFFRVSWYME